VGIWVPEATRPHLRRCLSGAGAGVRPMPEQNWHVTLRYLGDAEPDAVDQALRRSTLPQVTATVGSVLTRLGRSSLVVPVVGVDPLADAVTAATSDAVPLDLDHVFRGHITVARARPEVHFDDHRSPSSATFDVDEVALVASTLHADGATYATIGAYATVTGGGR
jgi:2'-5' RNA ligase